MLLFTLLTILVITIVIIALTIAGVIGGTVLIIFGDLIVCIAIIVFIIHHLVKRKN